MTKLTECLCALALYFGIWLSIVVKKQDLQLSETWDNFILLFPIITLVLFGVYSLSVILWRVYGFNDCPEAAKELQEQIIQAKEDLKSKGLKF